MYVPNVMSSLKLTRSNTPNLCNKCLIKNSSINWLICEECYNGSKYRKG